MTAREKAISSGEVAIRAEHARAYLMVAELISDDVTISAGNNLVGSLSVLAGIAAADAISGTTLKRRAAGDAHAESVGLLERATAPTSKAAASLSRLLASKTDTQYSPNLISSTKAREMLFAARRLVKEMDDVLRA